MRVAVFSTKPYDRQFFEASPEAAGHQLRFLEPRLNAETAKLAEGCEVVCAFVNDQLTEDVLESLHQFGVKLIALRCAGFNNVDLGAAHRLGIRVTRVPAYSPNAVAEHAVALMLALNRNIHRAFNRVRDGNFALDGLLGFDMVGKTVGVLGTGKIGAVAIRILKGFGCEVLAHDPIHDDSLGVPYVELNELLQRSDIVTLHMPLSPATHHLIGEQNLKSLKQGVMLINTSRGGLLDTRAVIEGLKSGQIGALGLDVYEEEADLFFEDQSGQVMQDDVFARLLTFPNVLITGHQAFFTDEALTQIASVTLGSISAFEKGEPLLNEVLAK